MTKKLVLHIGLAKTGTTTLQGWMYDPRNVEKLNSHNIGYSKYFLHDGGAHHKLAMLAKNNEWALIERTMIKLKNEMLSCNVALISSEELSTLTSVQIKTLSLLLKNVFDEVDVLATVRPHYSLVIAQYKQQVRVGYIDVGLAEYWAKAKKNSMYLRTNELLQPWRDLSSENSGMTHIACTESRIPGYSGDIIEAFSNLYCDGADLREGGMNMKNQNISLSSSQIVFVNNIKISFPLLWESGISLDHRRFVYFCFQHISERFIALSNHKDLDIMSCERLLFLDCISVFKNQWELLSSKASIFPTSDQILAWEENSLDKIDENIDKEIKNTRQKRHDLNEEDRKLLSFLFEFYIKNKPMHNTGPSVQLKYLKSKI